MKTASIAQMLCTMLYYRRFFPYYVYNVLVELDAEGAGCVYSYDPVGSYEREAYRAGGTSSAVLQAILDSLAGGKNRGRVAQKFKQSIFNDNPTDFALGYDETK